MEADPNSRLERADVVDGDNTDPFLRLQWLHKERERMAREIAELENALIQPMLANNTSFIAANAQGPPFYCLAKLELDRPLRERALVLRKVSQTGLCYDNAYLQRWLRFQD